MRLLASLAAAILALVAAAGAASSTGSSVLVVLEPELDKRKFSTFFGGLEKRGYELTFRAPRDATPLVIEDDVPKFSNVIVFAPSTKSFAPDLLPQSLVNLLSHNVNAIFTLSTAQTPLTSLASEFSLIIPPPHTPLISHFPKRSLPPTTIPITPPTSHSILTSNLPPILFKGIPHALGTNPFLVPILKAPEESFATDSDSDSGADALVDAADKGGEGLWAGSSMGVVTGFQAHGGARALWVGGVDVFSDEFAKTEVSKGVKSGNAVFCQDIAKWAFQESLVLRIDSTTHNHVNVTHDADNVPTQYTTNDMITYTTYISKWDPESRRWTPYSGINDLQLEFTMLDPHIRTALPAVRGTPGKYEVTFRAPDRHGVFKFVVDYKRKGWTHLHSAITVPVVPPRHDGYPRFLSAAWPYYAGAISTSVGFVLFSALWLAGDAVSEKARGKKKLE